MEQARINENIQKFEELLRSTNREGVERLLEMFIRKTDFYMAPASCMHYRAEDGGLLQHALDVYEILKDKYERADTVLGQRLRESGVTEDNLIITALLHDLYKVQHFKKQWKNQKSYEAEDLEDAERNRDRINRDNGGNYVWKTVEYYTVEDPYPIGTTDKSFAFAMRYTTLDWCEMAAIKWANGLDNNFANMDGMSESIRKYPLALALYESKMEAMYFRA